MKKVLLSLAFILSGALIFAQNTDQNVIATAGGYLENGTHSVSFTIGETVTTTVTDGNTTLTQGFQQSSWTIIDRINETNVSGTVKLWPNPAISFVNISFKSQNSLNNFKWKLMDVSGKTVKTGVGENGHARIELNELSQSVYFINIEDDKGVARNYKLIKN